MNKRDVLEQLSGLIPPPSLIELINFDFNVAKEKFYSHGFEFMVDIDKLGLKTYSEDIEFLDSFLEFANADGSGSTYAFWRKDKDRELNNLPIIIFGSEGGVHVVARCFDELLEILAYDSEPMVDHESVDFYRGEDDDFSDCHLVYKDWLYRELGIKSVREPSELLQMAQDEYEILFKDWLSNYYVN